MKPEKSLWPLGITLGFVLFAAGIATMVVIACTHKADLIRPDYYDQEIRYQTQLDRLNRTAQLSDQLKVNYSEATRRIIISLPAVHASQAPEGRIQLYRPSASGLDREFALKLDAAGAQFVDATGLMPGLWKVRVQWTVRNQEFFADRKIIVGDRKHANGSPTRRAWAATFLK